MHVIKRVSHLFKCVRDYLIVFFIKNCLPRNEIDFNLNDLRIING